MDSPLAITPRAAFGSTNLFINEIIPQISQRFIMLLYYPRPQPQCFNTTDCFIWSMHPPTRSTFHWADLRVDLYRCRESIREELTESKWVTSCSQLLLALRKHGFPKIPIISIRINTWHAAIDLNTVTFVETRISQNRASTSLSAWKFAAAHS